MYKNVHALSEHTIKAIRGKQYLFFGYMMKTEQLARLMGKATEHHREKQRLMKIKKELNK